MTEWIKAMAAEMVPPEDPSISSKNTEVRVVIAAENVDMGKLFKLLNSNGFPVVDIKQEIKKSDTPMVEGDMVQVNRDIVANSNITMKTSTALYNIPEAVLPAGYMGQVVASNKNAVTVQFDANIPVTAYDQSGYISKVSYYVGTLELNKKDLTKI